MALNRDLTQPAVDLLDGRIERLIDRLVIDLAADLGAIELFAVEQHDDRVLELHARHFARERHVADRELVFSVRGEVVLDDEAAARAERHARQMMLLPARAGSTVRRQRDDHVRGVAVLRRDGQRRGIADCLERDRARGVDVLIDERRRHLERVRVVVEVALDVVLGEQRCRIDLEREQVADGVRVLAAVQAAQRDTTGRSLTGGRVDLAGEPRREAVQRLAVGSPRTGRRHEPAAQFADRELPGLRVGGNPVRRQPIERSVTRQVVLVVALEAVFFDDRPLLLFGMGLRPQISPAAGRCDDAYECDGKDDFG